MRYVVFVSARLLRPQPDKRGTVTQLRLGTLQLGQPFGSDTIARTWRTFSPTSKNAYVSCKGYLGISA